MVRMIFASCRRNFWSPVFHGDLAMIDEYGTPITPEALEARVRGKRVCILVHGYHVDRDGILRAYPQMEGRIKTFGVGYDEVIGFIWPGGIVAALFELDVARADESGPYLATLITMVGAAARVDVETHSLGARVALMAIRDSRLRIDDLWLTAPAVNADCLTSYDGEFCSVLHLCRTIHVLYSNGDKVLKWAYPAASLFRHQALGYNGPMQPSRLPSNVRTLNCTDFIEEHGDYRKMVETYQYWAKMNDAPIAAAAGTA